MDAPVVPIAVCFKHNAIYLEGEWIEVVNGNVAKILLSLRFATGVEKECPICLFSRGVYSKPSE